MALNTTWTLVSYNVGYNNWLLFDPLKNSPINNIISLKSIRIRSKIYNIITTLFGIASTHRSKIVMSNNRAHVIWNPIKYGLMNIIKYLLSCVWIIKFNYFPVIEWSKNWYIYTVLNTWIYPILNIWGTRHPLLVQMGYGELQSYP